MANSFKPGFSRNGILITLLLLGGIFLLTSLLGDFGKEIDFNTQVKPILNQHCAHCHGGVKVESGFNLMTRETALQPTDSDEPAIVPGSARRSEMIRRITSHDPEERMPYEEEPLDEADIEILSRWIDEGAKWGKHWAYQAVQPTDPPQLRGKLWGLLPSEDEEWIRNDIDRFIAARLQDEDLAPAPEADPAVLLRRVSLDLTGLPAPQHLTEAYLKEDGSLTYAQLVDSLLASPHYGERWTAMWMDLARYADSKGFERDGDRDIWLYRDWLIRAFNQDLPYDQFLTEQLAGDLLPNPTDAQYIATGFHRNTTTNDEGGTDNEEYRVAATLDRVNTTWEAIMSTTFACTQCHSHPYDPILHEEYYQFLAFFNNTRDEDSYDDYPILRQLTPEDSSELVLLTEWLQTKISPQKADEIYKLIRTWQPSINSLVADQMVNADIYDTKFLGFRQNGTARIANVNLSNKEQVIYRYTAGMDGGKLTIHLDSLNGPVIATDAIPAASRWELRALPLQETAGVHDLHFSYYNPNLRNPKGVGLRFDWLHFNTLFPGEGLPAYAENKARFWALLRAKPTATTLIMIENPVDLRRSTHVFDRGNWLVKGEEVAPKVPEIFEPLPAGAPDNRLGLAQWITDTNHPLTARTLVNRLWEQLFGRGIVTTLEDFGTQGEPPTHPALLDYLAYEFMHQHQWSIKDLLREIVLSATYRQSSKVNAELLEKDPYNHLLARGPRVRLNAEQIRDQALVVSGLFQPKMYGPSVMPSQPEGLWNSPYNGDQWELSPEEDRYRRAIYTYWKRSNPYPAMLSFDMTTREVCSARRVNTNTPLQALVTLNDPAFMELAVAFARKIQTVSSTDDPSAQIATGYQLAIGRVPSADRLHILLGLYQQSIQEFGADPAAAAAMLVSNTEKKPPTQAQTAALAVVANAILNLDEFITKQ